MKKLVLKPNSNTKIKVDNEFSYEAYWYLAKIIKPILEQLKQDSKDFVLIWVKRKHLPKKFKNDFEKDVVELYTTKIEKEEAEVYLKAIEYSQWCLDKMIKAFDIILTEQHFTDKQSKQVEKGLKLFGKYYQQLGY